MYTMTVSKYVGGGGGGQGGGGTRGIHFRLDTSKYGMREGGREGRLTIGYICYRWCEGSLYKKNGTQA
jgi:hypothetical protein